MGNHQTKNVRINFEDMQHAMTTHPKYTIINTLPENEQQCLIKHTIPAQQEEVTVNRCIETRKTYCPVIIYGKNTNDLAVLQKHDQLVKMGFTQVYLYPGGLFEWLTLQDIYGKQEFPTTSDELDLLKYKPHRVLHDHLIEYRSY